LAQAGAASPGGNPAAGPGGPSSGITPGVVIVGGVPRKVGEPGSGTVRIRPEPLMVPKTEASPAGPSVPAAVPPEAPADAAAVPRPATATDIIPVIAAEPAPAVPGKPGGAPSDPPRSDSRG
jgi:hypothetical protein